MQRALQAELDRIKTDGVTADELNRAKRQFARDYILGRETVQQKALHLAHAVVIHDDVTTADGEFDLFQNVTLEDVQRVAHTYFTPQSRMLLTIMPRGAGDQPDAGIAASQGVCDEAPASPASRPWPCSASRRRSSARSRGRASVRRDPCRLARSISRRTRSGLCRTACRCSWCCTTSSRR